MSNHINHVYVMHAPSIGGGRRVKIGISRCPDRRRSHIASFMKIRDLRVVRAWERHGDAHKVERSIHLALVGKRVINEWFDMTPAQACRAVERLIAKYDADNR